mmetsp:Transcript_6423/g.11433  ORF Transcript_6423/g.11433 Transcript_6423/m.11433 type:complete len:275 (-) Transcript_6423:46-870(-)
MSDTASFVDPVFLARFGLSRVNVLDYFLHPLNPFRSKATNTSNEILQMQGIGIGTLMQNGTGMPGQQQGGGGPPRQLSLSAAEHEYQNALSRLIGEQYELLPPTTIGLAPEADANSPPVDPAQSPLFTIRHVHRTNPTTIKIVGIYYVLEGVIYKSPSVRSLMKANVARTLEGLSGACDALNVCARYEPSTGYTWNFETTTAQKDDEEYSSCALLQHKRRKRRRILDNRRPGERTAEEEEGIRASEAIDRILVRLTKSSVVSGHKQGKSIKTSS